MRAPGSQQQVREALLFDGEEPTIEIEVGQDELMGQIVPARSELVILEGAEGHVDEAPQTMPGSSSSGGRLMDQSG